MGTLARAISTACGGMLSALLLAGCSSGGDGGSSIVGNGVKPDHLLVVLSTDSRQTGPLNIYQCQIGQLAALLVFSDGSVGNFTRRVTWRSEAPTSVQVSNGDVPVESGTGFYNFGTIIPGAGGTTNIIADYQGLSARMTVSVLSPDSNSFSIVSADPASQDYLKPPTVSAAPDSTLWLGAGTTYRLKVIASLGGIPQDMSSFALWDFVNGGDSGVVTVSSASGVVSALRAGSPQTVRARFPGCTTSVTLPVGVANVQSLDLQPEFGTDPLLVGNSEKIRVLADLGNDGSGNPLPQQDVSSLVSDFWVSDSSALTFVSTSGLPNLATAVGQNNQVIVTASKSFANQATLTSSPLQMSTVSGTLQSIISVSADSNGPLGAPPLGQLPALQSGSVYFMPFIAIGNYLLDDGVTPQLQDITRLVTWSVNETNLATISTDVATAGRVTAPLRVPAGVLTVTATPPASAADTTAVTGLLQLQ